MTKKMKEINITRTRAAVPRSGSRKIRTKVTRVKAVGRGNPRRGAALGGVNPENELDIRITRLILASSEGWKEKVPT